MIRMNGKKSAFTLVELLVVVAMIAVLMGAFTTSVAAAQNRARIQKATSDVKIITQAILAYENFEPSHQLPTMKDAEADAANLKFLLGQGGTAASGEKIPVLLMAALTGGGAMRDPWGRPYKICITPGGGNVRMSVGSSDMKAGYFLPNFYRLGIGERSLWKSN